MPEERHTELMKADRPSVPNSPLWDELLAAPRHNPRELIARNITTDKGVYMWVRGGLPIYAGRAKGKAGLQDRLKAHLATGLDLSRSTFRSWVAVTVLDIDRSTTRQRPSVMTVAQVQQVNEWVSRCQVGWITRATAAEVIQFEKTLLNAWKPPLNR